jgi:hypothetical protein
MRLHELFETATAGGTSSGSIATVVNPHISPGKARGKKSYTGTPGKSGTKSPAQPSVKTANALDSNVSLFGGGSAIKR